MISGQAGFLCHVPQTSFWGCIQADHSDASCYSPSIRWFMICIFKGLLLFDLVLFVTCIIYVFFIVIGYRLESRGPCWTAPTMADIVRRQPFLADQGESMLLWLRAYAELRSYTPGQCIVPRKVRHASCSSMVQNGMFIQSSSRCVWCSCRCSLQLLQQQ